ncbi:MAG: branched-chain-amino-acid transaminase [Planctomycetota bacterium]|jgi:branched-chain amino acid aminotransferase
MKKAKNPFAPNPELKIWMDGELVPAGDARISVFDHGLLYGDGCFEGIRVYNGKIWKEAEHIKRFFESAKAIMLELPLAREEVSQAMHEALEANHIDGDGYVRLVATRGIGSLGISIKHTACPTVFVIADRIQLYPPELYETGLNCITASVIRNHPNSLSPRIKSLNYLNNIIAKAEAFAAGADEAVMLNHEGHVSECTGDNLFIVRNGVIQTPPASEGILEGITRNFVMELARQQGCKVEERELIRHDLFVADEVFLTGTAAEIIPVVSLDGRKIGDGKPGKVTKTLTEAFIAARA